MVAGEYAREEMRWTRMPEKWEMKEVQVDCVLEVASKATFTD